MPTFQGTLNSLQTFMISQYMYI